MLATPQSSGEQSDEKIKKVFVGGLDRSTTKEDIESTFQARGTVCTANSFYIFI